ncbi:hypothetical protein AVEN_36050-1 [Araneus ventricosus]|uniref:Uncharacterized protein n=1 Tax=Araneus ventricosus TaxID=182803 RepID=A0A4Y2Q8Q1_ARAVE|nr:hypothetical protein AVEN_36050-1 [Araneus ventricosus]
MAYVLKVSPESFKSELELFHLPATQTAIENGHWVEFHPLSNVFNGGHVEFHIFGSGEGYLNMRQTQLYVKGKIFQSDGLPKKKETKTGPDSTPSSTETKIGPVNLCLHLLFSQVDVSLNDRFVSNLRNTCLYRSYIRHY